MSFKSILTEGKISIKDFIIAVNSYTNLDQALEELPDEYVEFYLKNINNKQLNKELKKLKLVEDYEVYDKRTTTDDPTNNRFKKINYKGEYIILTWDQRYGWIPQVSFRSIAKATKYIKKLADEFMD
jgi:hypothetical protein